MSINDETPAISQPLTIEQFREQLRALPQTSGKPTDALLFSDLDRARVGEVRRVWPTLATPLRRRLINQMSELAEEQIEYNFHRALKVALRDADAEVRAIAIGGLWEDDGEDLIAYLLDEGVVDSDASVREAATRALARFSQLLAEGELPDRWSEPLRDRLLTLVRSNDTPEIRRRAIEALASYIDDDEVIAEIERAYRSNDERTQMSALYSMGRNQDERWFPILLEEMESDAAGLRYEATRAIGEFGDRRAMPQLVERLGDDDREVKLAAIGSIGQVGGEAAIKILRRLASSDEEDVREAAEEALDEAAFLANPLGILGRTRDLADS